MSPLASISANAESDESLPGGASSDEEPPPLVDDDTTDTSETESDTSNSARSASSDEDASDSEDENGRRRRHARPHGSSRRGRARARIDDGEGEGDGDGGDDDDVYALNEGYSAVFRRLLKLSKNKSELAWWHVLQTLMTRVERECCDMRERTLVLRTTTFESREDKDERVEAYKEKYGTRHDMHEAMTAQMHMQHVLLWRSLHVSDLPPSQTNEGVRLAAIMLQQSEARMSNSYRAVDDAMRAFEARLPTNALTSMCETIPAAGAHAIPGFENRTPEELVCSICLCQVEEVGTVVCTLTCGHAFHLECLESWLHGNPTCPMCRHPVGKDEEEEEDEEEDDEDDGEVVVEDEDDEDDDRRSAFDDDEVGILR